jgi:D-alanyl-D-alanine carboxypeptidase (penicillin-binding protein 5/6)
VILGMPFAKPILALALWSLLSLAGGVSAQNAQNAQNAPNAQSVANADRGGGAAEADDERRRVEMLERLADQLSHRMRTIREREAALSAREEALALRERMAREREENLAAMEELLRSREAILKRRERLPPPQTWNGPPAPAIYGRYAAVLDGGTMQFYHKKEAEARVPVASTQKLVTALVVCHEGGLDELAEVPDEVLRVEPTVVGVKPGERYTRRQLLTALLVKSGNDIAATLAIDNAGSVAAFAEKMNRYARHIGMTDSNFVNPHGLPAEGQYSTARDIAIAAFEAYQDPDIREMVSTKAYDFVFNDGRVYTLPNTNRVLGQMEGCNGMKTGFTYAAGNCLVCSASVDGQDRISVVLKSARPQVQEDSIALLTWSFGLEFTGPMEDEAEGER